MLDPKRLEVIRSAQEDGINGYNTLSSRDYCVLLGELLADREETTTRLEKERDDLREKLLAAEVSRDDLLRENTQLLAAVEDYSNKLDLATAAASGPLAREVRK